MLLGEIKTWLGLAGIGGTGRKGKVGKGQKEDGFSEPWQADMGQC